MNTHTNINQNVDKRSRWDVSYEWKAVTLLCLAFGLVGMDRFMLLPLFPVIAPDLTPDHPDLGQITDILPVASGVSALS